MSKPDISIVIPAFNRENTILRAIDSVVGQTFKNWELLVIDDCSTDRTIQLIQDTYSNDSRISVEKLQQNGGANRARNHGARVARASLITFFDSDDKLHPSTLQNHYDKFTDDRNLGLSYVFATCIKNGKVVATFDQKVNADAERILFKGFHGIGSATSGLCVRKDVFEDIGGFDIDMPSHQDLDFLVRVAGKYPINFIENSNTLMYWDECNRISDNSEAVVKGAAHFFYKHEKRLRELDIYHHIARKLTRKYALLGKNKKEAYRILGKAIAHKPFYFYAYLYALKIPFLYHREID